MVKTNIKIRNKNTVNELNTEYCSNSHYRVEIGGALKNRYYNRSKWDNFEQQTTVGI